MRKLALNDEILLKIEKPARYIGNEVNSVMKDPSNRNVALGDSDIIRYVQQKK